MANGEYYCVRTRASRRTHERIGKRGVSSAPRVGVAPGCLPGACWQPRMGQRAAIPRSPFPRQRHLTRHFPTGSLKLFPHGSRAASPFLMCSSLLPVLVVVGGKNIKIFAAGPVRSNPSSPTTYHSVCPVLARDRRLTPDPAPSTNRWQGLREIAGLARPF